MTSTEKTVEDYVYEKLLDLGFTAERIAMMNRDELRLWVTALLWP